LISTISVTPWLCSCCWNDALATAQGTVWSCSPEMISSGPRSGCELALRGPAQGREDDRLDHGCRRLGQVLDEELASGTG
jgi:hypothetical protein